MYETRAFLFKEVGQAGWTGKRGAFDLSNLSIQNQNLNQLDRKKPKKNLHENVITRNEEHSFVPALHTLLVFPPPLLSSPPIQSRMKLDKHNTAHGSSFSFAGLLSGGAGRPPLSRLFGSSGGGVVAYKLDMFYLFCCYLVSMSGVSSAFLHQPLHHLKTPARASPQQRGGSLFKPQITPHAGLCQSQSMKCGNDPRTDRCVFSAQKKRAKKSGNRCEPIEKKEALAGCLPPRCMAVLLFFFSAGAWKKQRGHKDVGNCCG